MALEGPQCAGVGLAPSGLAAITTTLLAVLKRRRSSAGLRQRLPSHPQFLQRHARPLRRRDHLFRSADRRRHRQPVQAQHQGGAGRGARLAVLRNARHSRDRRGRACARRARHRRQHLGDAAVSPLARARRRYQHAGRDQIYRRPFRHHVRHDFGQREGLAAGRRGASACSASAPDPTTCSWRCAACARFRCGWRSITGPALEMARWLAGRPEVVSVLHPALESHPGHAIWKRDFTGASGLFSIVLKPVPQKAVDALLDTVKLFGMGYSWGGFESLIIPFDCDALSHRDQMVAGRPDAAAPHRPGECRRPQGRSRARLCGVQGRRVGRLFLLDF